MLDWWVWDKVQSLNGKYVVTGVTHLTSWRVSGDFSMAEEQRHHGQSVCCRTHWLLGTGVKGYCDG